MRDLRVLYVEDDQYLRDLFLDFFELEIEEDCVVDLAENGKKGLDLYKENKYDVVFTDINMPQMDGIQMLKEFKKLEKEHSPIYVVTGLPDNELNLNKIQQEIPLLEKILSKPVNHIDLVNFAKKHQK